MYTESTAKVCKQKKVFPQLKIASIVFTSIKVKLRLKIQTCLDHEEPCGKVKIFHCGMSDHNRGIDASFQVWLYAFWINGYEDQLGS